ncbi:ABC-2 transporter permease [Lacticaseibacillus paracasei]|uniref:ABC-2 transporter permease n=1 Tax=Lacticaseibacillus paracasei TaxID=1597 RepID=UPI00403F1C91
MRYLFKEYALAAHPTTWFFLWLGALVLVPTYPYSMIFFFAMLEPTLDLSYAKQTNDILFTALLPQGKAGVVWGKVAYTFTFQAGMMLLTIPWAWLRTLYIQNNPISINANLTYFGFGLLALAVFDFALLTGFFKTGAKIGWPYFWGTLPAIVILGVMETLPHLPGLAWTNSVQPDHLLQQMPFFIIGIGAFIVSFFLTLRRSQRHFSVADL